MSAEAATIRLKEGEELFQRLGMAVSFYRIFSASHPRFLDSCQNFLKAVEDFFAAHPEQKNLVFVHRKGQVFFRRVPMMALTPPAIKLAQLFSNKKLEGLRIGPHSNLTALTCVIDALFDVDPNGDEPTWKAINRFLENQGVKPLLGFFARSEFSEFVEADGDLRPAETAERVSPLLSLPELAMPLELYKSTLVALHDLMSILGSGGNPRFDTLIDVARRITSGVVEGDHEFLQLASVHYSEEFTFNHSVNVCLLAIAALKPLAENPEWLIKIGQAALLHDLGKSMVPQELLYTDAALGEEEREEIERHCLLGAEVLQDSAGIDPLAVVVAYDHHRRPEGRGYPLRRRDRPLDILTSLVAAADILEALIAERPYKRGLSPAQAFDVFARLPEARGLEPAFRLLFDAISPFPPGTFVQLDTGEYAVVSRTRTGVPDRPWVRLISITGGERLISPEELDLADPASGGAYAPSIARALPSRWWSSDPTAPADAVFDEQDREPGDFDRRVADGTLLKSEA